MPTRKYRFRMYQDLLTEAPAVLEEARKAAQEIGLAGSKSQPDGVGDAAAEDQGAQRSPGRILDRIREVVKDAYGDSYDCCPVSSPSVGLWIACRAGFAPAPGLSRSVAADPRLRCIVPRQKGLVLPGGFGPFPPKYKCIPDPAGQATGGAAAVTLSQDGLDAVIVPLEGAVYACHGASLTPASLLTATNYEASLEVIAATAAVQAPYLCGVFSQGASTPGCGFGTRDERGVHVLAGGLRELAAEFDVPCIIDEAFGLPFIGGIPDPLGTSIEVYGHPAMGGMGLIVGTEDLVTPLLKEVTRLSAAGQSPAGLPGLLDLLSDLKADPGRYRRVVERLHDIVTSELGDLEPDFKQELRIRKDYGSLSVEVNYEDTWRGGQGFPIFTMEDSRAGTNLLEAGISAMGIASVTVLEASITVHVPNPGPARFELDDDRTKLEIRGLAKLLEILGRRSRYLS